MTGDQVLRDIAMEIGKLFKEDIVGRWGGDEFDARIKIGHIEWRFEL